VQWHAPRTRQLGEDTDSSEEQDHDVQEFQHGVAPAERSQLLLWISAHEQLRNERPARALETRTLLVDGEDVS
jgi:hypothetical protein